MDRNEDSTAGGPVAIPMLPASARLPINRCNLPAVILGSLTFQRHPAPLLIDGVAELHADLFQRLDRLDDPEKRASQFMDYMVVRFRLARLEEAGLDDRTSRRRVHADYLHLVRGWSFSPDGREGAVLKGWVESRFGLLPRHHKEPIPDPASEPYLAYLEERIAGLYNTNALEAQLDLLYTYSQYELARQAEGGTHLRLYRGVNRLDGHEILWKGPRGRQFVLLNNVNSFTDSRERADEFGDYILETDVPLAKIFFSNRLLPGMLRGEDEYVVVGGMYDVQLKAM